LANCIYIFNFLVPDPIPILDEAFMMASIFKKNGTASKIMDFAEEHPKLFRVLFVGIIINFFAPIKIILFS